jgi:hypothetical protein
MDEPRTRARRAAAAAFAACLMLIGCSSSAATPVVVYVTPEPTFGDPISFDAAISFGAPVSFGDPTPVPTPTPTPTRAPTPTPTRAPTPTPKVTATGVWTMPPPVVPPTVRPCTGTDDQKFWFWDQARARSFAVYCGVLPTGWSIEAYTANPPPVINLPDLWSLTIFYAGPETTQWIELYEGNLCIYSSQFGCTPPGPYLGSVAFGDLSGQFVSDEATRSVWIYVAQGTPQAYSMRGVGFWGPDVRTFLDIAAAMHKVVP